MFSGLAAGQSDKKLPVIPSGGLNQSRHLSRRMSFEQPNYGEEQSNPFDLEIIPDKRYHQSDNENVDQKKAELYYLRVMTEFLIFHSLILLLKSDDEHDKLILRNEFFSLIKNENVLPAERCREVLFHYEMHEEALLFLFYRKDQRELMQLIRQEFEVHKLNKPKRNFWLSKAIRYCKKINGKK